MKCENIVRTFAGLVVLITLLLGAKASPFFLSNYILWITAFVGANLFQSGLTKFCLLEKILKKANLCDSK